MVSCPLLVLTLGQSAKNQLSWQNYDFPNKSESVRPKAVQRTTNDGRFQKSINGRLTTNNGQLNSASAALEIKKMLASLIGKIKADG